MEIKIDKSFQKDTRVIKDNDKETLIIKRKSGKGVVVIPIEEYNSLIETLHLLGSRKNAERLFESMDELLIPDVFEEDIELD